MSEGRRQKGKWAKEKEKWRRQRRNVRKGERRGRESRGRKGLNYIQKYQVENFKFKSVLSLYDFEIEI